MHKSRGFTLVELLVTISIIAILSVIGLVVYSSVMKQGRDSKRLSDMRLIQSALDQYYIDQGYYPKFWPTRFCVNGQINVYPGGDNCPLKDPSGNKTYLNIFPKISTKQQYTYQGFPPGCERNSDTCTSYCLYADLENPITDFVMPSTCTATYNFAVTPP